MSAITVLQPNGAEVNHKTLAGNSPALIELNTSQDDWVYPYPTTFKIHEHPIDEVRELKVAVIGAGLAGIIAGALLPAKVPGIELTILEKNADLVSQLLARHISETDLMYRAEHGTRTRTQEFAATSLPMFTRRHFLQILSGLRSTPKAQRSGTTGRMSLRSTMSTPWSSCRPRF